MRSEGSKPALTQDFGETPTGAQPLVSIFVPTYNGERFIAETLDSVLAQTYENFELIFVDDCSTDRSVDIVRDATRDPRVKLFAKNVREGPCKARNYALAHTRGSLLCWLDQDDLWMPTKLQQQVDIMAARPDVGLIYTHFHAFDSQTGARLLWPDGWRQIDGDVLAALFRLGCFIGSITTMFRREVFPGSVPVLRERDFSFGDDYFLWLSIALRWQIVCIPNDLAAYRRHAANESARLTEHSNIALDVATLLHEFVGEFPETRQRLGGTASAAIAYRLMVAAFFELHRGKRMCALRLALRALRLDPATTAQALRGDERLASGQ